MRDEKERARAEQEVREALLRKEKEDKESAAPVESSGMFMSHRWFFWVFRGKLTTSPSYPSILCGVNFHGHAQQGRSLWFWLQHDVLA